jgi:DNA end-binding protein Ku
MSARATWKGELKIGLVNVRIKVYTATESREGISFNQLHDECCTRIQQKRWCPKCEKEVANVNIVKGYQFEKDKYVTMTDDEIGDIKVESTRNINVDRFVDRSELDPIYINRTYFLGPEDVGQGEAYALLREAMGDKVAIGKVAIYGREYPVAVVTSGRGLRMHTLHFGKEIRDLEETVPNIDRVPTSVANHPHMAIARQVVAAMEGELDFSEFKDEYAEAVIRTVQGKVAGAIVEQAQPEQVQPTPSSLFDALSATLQAVQAAPKKPAKARAKKDAPVVEQAVVEEVAKPKRIRRIA